MARFFWAKEEIILAADLADDRGWKGPNSQTPEVIELSNLLRSASIHPRELRDENFRSASSVSLKVNNLIASHPNSRKKGLRTSASELSVVEDFINDRAGMKQAAAEIRDRIRAGHL